MKILFYFLLMTSFSFAQATFEPMDSDEMTINNIYNNDESSDDNSNSELSSDLSAELKEELNFLNRKDTELLQELKTENNSIESQTSDEVTLTRSAIKREPAVVNDDDLKSLLDPKSSDTKKRRVRSR